MSPHCHCDLIRAAAMVLLATAGIIVAVAVIVYCVMQGVQP